MYLLKRASKLGIYQRKRGTGSGCKLGFDVSVPTSRDFQLTEQSGCDILNSGGDLYLINDELFELSAYPTGVTRET